VTEPVGDPFSSASGPRVPAGPPIALPKLWIGYLLAAVTFFGEVVAVARNPELAKQGQFMVPPLEIFLPAFVARVYWLVCVYRYHKILASIPGWKHPISPGKAVGFHFIPFFNAVWVFLWPTAVAAFVQSRLKTPRMRGWVVGLGILASILCQVLLDAAFGVALLFMAAAYVSAFLSRALNAPPALPEA